MSTMLSEPRPPQPATTQVAPAAWIVAPHFGAGSEVWMWRQVLGMTRLRPRVICSQYQNRQVYPVENVPVDELLINGPDPDADWRRWPRRLRNAASGNFFASTGAELRGLLRLARNHPPDVLLCHFGHTALRMLPVARRFKVPLVAHFHGMDLSSMLRNRWYRKSLTGWFNALDAVVVVGSRQREVALSLGANERRIHQIPCGVPTDQFEPQPRQDDDKIRIAVISRLVEGKGVEFVLRSYGRIADQLPKSELHIMGDGPLLQPLRVLSTSLVTRGSVFFHGSLPNDGVRSRLAECDIFVQHSVTASDGWFEGFGVSVAEAAAMGLPVVGTRSGGIIDQVVHEQTGLLVEERDVDATAAAILRLARDPALRQRLGQAGRRRTIERFDTARQIQRLEDVLLSVVKAGINA
jgi:colanic acid/amylovoran biosynthesis glycosyltransferase